MKSSNEWITIIIKSAKLSIMLSRLTTEFILWSTGTAKNVKIEISQPGLKECENKDKYLDLAREVKKTIEHEGENYTNCDWCFWHGN